jgi:energy-converting hydrogenase A subunit M
MANNPAFLHAIVRALVKSDDITERLARLATIEATLAQLRERYDVLMNAFRFEAAKAVHARIEDAETERRAVVESLPPSPPKLPPAPFTVARRPRRR